jgi:hypothetical protein
MPRNDLPEEYNDSDYLTVDSVVNTLYRALNLPSSFKRELLSGGEAKLLSSLL